MVGTESDGLPGGVLALSADLRIVAANDWLGELVGRDPSSLVGESLDRFLSRPSQILFQTHVYPALSADGRVEEVYLTLAGAGDDRIPVLFNAIRSPRSDGGMYRGLMVRIPARARWEQDLLDATRDLAQEREAGKRLAAELSATVDELTSRHEQERRRHEFRDAFIGVVSHELRTPITTIFGMSHVLRSRIGSMDVETVAGHLGDIVDESDRLRRLTEDLLVLSRAEGGKLEVAREPLLIRRITERVVEVERARSGGRPITITANATLPIVLGEDIYVEQTLRNLLNNALKYSPADQPVTVDLRTEAEGAAVRVRDAGPGVPTEARERLFDVFHREPDAIRQTSGAGIGLFVCRELIRAMDGRIWVTDAPPPAQRGAEFGFWLPGIATD